MGTGDGMDWMDSGFTSHSEGSRSEKLVGSVCEIRHLRTFQF